jgi:hypothetical protein
MLTEPSWPNSVQPGQPHVVAQAHELRIRDGDVLLHRAVLADGVQAIVPLEVCGPLLAGGVADAPVQPLGRPVGKGMAADQVAQELLHPRDDVVVDGALQTACRSSDAAAPRAAAGPRGCGRGGAGGSANR